VTKQISTHYLTYFRWQYKYPHILSSISGDNINIHAIYHLFPVTIYRYKPNSQWCFFKFMCCCLFFIASWSLSYIYVVHLYVSTPCVCGGVLKLSALKKQIIYVIFSTLFYSLLCKFCIQYLYTTKIFIDCISIHLYPISVAVKWLDGVETRP
jgi:hypothetical protein